MSNQGQVGPKHSDIKIKLVLKSLQAFVFHVTSIMLFICLFHVPKSLHAKFG